MADDKKRNWGVDTYSKWDKFEDDDEEQTSIKPTQFNLGDNKAKVKDVVYTVENDERVKKVKKVDKEIWQVVVRKLRVWSAESQPAADGSLIPCRPFSVFVSCLHPSGKILCQELVDPPEKYPTPQQTLEVISRAILNPISGDQRRPMSITFADATLAGELYNSLSKWQIEASELSESEGVDEVVEKYSQLLIEKDIANIGPSSEKPGFLSVKDVSVGLAKSVFRTCATYLRTRPWINVHERQAYEMVIKDDISVVVDNAKNITIEPARVWFSILGCDSHRSLAELNRDPNETRLTFGIALFYSKLDLEARLVPPQEAIYLDPTPKEDRCSYSGVTKSELGRDLKRTKPRKVDIRTGEEIMYADMEALKKHWPLVKKYVIELTDLEKGRKERRSHWIGTECTVLFEQETLLPFDDLDAIDRNELEVVSRSEAKDVNDQCFPLLLQFKKGEPDRPSPVQFALLDIAMKAALKLDPSIKGMSQLLNLEMSSDAVSREQIAVEVSPVPVHFVSEAKAAMERKMKNMKVDENKKDDDVGVEPDSAKTAEEEEEDEDTAPTEKPEEGKQCSIH